MAVGDNNPRVFSATMTLDAWRSAFSCDREAKLHIDVAFAEQGRVGGGVAPVRFRLSLRRAEVHVIRDSQEVIKIDPRSVMRSEIETSKQQRVSEKKTNVKGGIRAALSRKSVDLSASAEAVASTKVTERLEHSTNVSPIKVSHWKTDRGYCFRLDSRRGGLLVGQPWAAAIPVLTLIDTGGGRKRGEPPEVRIEIHCLREDLVLDDIAFTSSRFPDWTTLPRAKQIAVEQYIRDELTRSGLPCEDLSDPFSRIVLGDVSPGSYHGH